MSVRRARNLIFMPSQPFLTVVIPCYNERQNLERGVLSSIADYLSKQPYQWEVLISDDGSTDGSQSEVQSFKHPKFRLLQNQHGGKAQALRSGLFQAKGEYTLFTDMDQSTPIDQLDKLIPHAQNNVPVVIGSRGIQRKNFAWYRQLASATFGAVRRAILLPRIEDTQCGFKLVHTATARNLFDRMLIFQQAGQAKGWTVAAWDVEFLFLARKNRHQIKEIRVNWQDEDSSTGKNRTAGKFLRESVDMLKQILRVRLNDLSGKYE